jgi:hypothetical protein
LVEEINNRQHLIAKTTAKQYPLSVWLHSFFSEREQPISNIS